jgi:hypothetical protein
LNWKKLHPGWPRQLHNVMKKLQKTAYLADY